MYHKPLLQHYPLLVLHFYAGGQQKEHDGAVVASHTCTVVTPINMGCV